MSFSSKLSEYASFALLSTAASVGVAATLVVVKLYAYSLSGATGVLASLTDSASDLGISLIAFFSMHYALKPADKEHRHGHGNMEGITALLQAAFIGAAAFFLGSESVSRILSPSPISLDATVLILMGISLFLSAALVWIQNYALSRARSLIVEADMAHYSSDIAVTAATIAVLILTGLGLPAVLDPLFALGVAGYLLFTAYRIARKALDMLLDRELPDEERQNLKSIIRSHPGVLSFHDLRTKQSGIVIFISMDIVVDADLSLREAHAIAKTLEAGIMEEYSRAEVIIHVDPADDIEDARHKNF